MRGSLIGIVAAIVALGNAALAQSNGQRMQHGQPSSSYADFKGRAVKALSEIQTADLRAGRGMGFALAAELNSYPGPMHALEFASQLDLNEDQRKRLSAMSIAMKTEAIALGEKVIALEAELDRLFATHAITPASLEAVTQSIGRQQASLRASHLKYHLFTRDLLTTERTYKYDQLRGYVTSRDQPVQKKP